MEYVTLNNGIKMPKLGYGVYQTPLQETPSAVCWTPSRRWTAARACSSPTMTPRPWSGSCPSCDSYVYIIVLCKANDSL